MGEDSYVKIRSVPYAMVQEAAAKKDSKDTTPDEEQEFTEKLLKASVIEWNWVDDDDKPLPDPNHEDWDLGNLLINEVEFLVESVMGREKGKN